MATITEDYVSFETARLLKEKGFDVYGDGSLNSGIEVFAEYSPSGTFNKCITSKPHQKAYPAPTLQMAMKWLREVYNLFIQITVDFSDGAYPMYDVCVVNLAICTSNVVNGYDRYSYKEAVETAIKYCLENII